MDRRAALRDNTQGSDDEDSEDDGDEAEGGARRDKRDRRGGGGRGQGQEEVLDQWQHCASVLCNAARSPEGRCDTRHNIKSIS